MIKPQTVYKLTDENGQTYAGTQWGPGITHTAAGNESQSLCSDAWIHAYESPLLAVLFNPIHANFQNPILWEAEGVIGKRDGQLKCGCRTLTTIRQIPLPVITIEQMVKFAIYCGLEVYENEDFVTWANNWLNGSDRTAAAADAVWHTAVYGAARAARWSAAAAVQASAAKSADAARMAAARTSRMAAAEAAAEAAADAAWSASDVEKELNLIELAQRSIS